MKKKNGYPTSSYAFAMLVAEKVFTMLVIILLAGLYIHINGFHSVYIIILVLFAVVQVVVFGFEVILYISPIRKLERAVAKVETADYLDEEDNYEYFREKKRGVSINHLIRHVKTAIQNDYKSQMLKSQAEMHALQSQINPHFLYNTLETIRSQAIAQKANDIAKMTEALATLFRYSISRPREMATFADEMENVNHYLVIQQYRFPSKFIIVKRIEDESILNYKLPILTIQPIIENAIHHGLETKMGTGTVTIRAFSTQSRLIVNISDDGSGMSMERLNQLQEALHNSIEENEGKLGSEARNDGIALINVNQRLKFYFGSEYGLKVYSTQNVGTSVEISLPKI